MIFTLAKSFLELEIFQLWCDSHEVASTHLTQGGSNLVPYNINKLYDMVHGTLVIPIPFHWSACPGQDWWWFGIHQGIDVVCCRLTHSAFEPGTSSSVTFKTYILPGEIAQWGYTSLHADWEITVDEVISVLKLTVFSINCSLPCVGPQLLRIPS